MQEIKLSDSKLANVYFKSITIFFLFLNRIPVNPSVVCPNVEIARVQRELHS